MLPRCVDRRERIRIGNGTTIEREPLEKRTQIRAKRATTTRYHRTSPEPDEERAGARSRAGRLRRLAAKMGREEGNGWPEPPARCGAPLETDWREWSGARARATELLGTPCLAVFRTGAGARAAGGCVVVGSTSDGRVSVSRQELGRDLWWRAFFPNAWVD
jgi:hypothetical protein